MKKKIALVLVVVLALTVFFNLPSDSNAKITSESIEEKEEQIEQAEEERKNLQNSLTDIKAVKKELEEKKKDLSNYVTELDARLVAIQQHIDTLNAQIAEKEAEIVITQDELVKAKEKEARQYESIEQLIQYNYEQGEVSYLEILFSGESISDILNNAEYLEQVYAYEKQALEEYKLNRQLIEITEETLITEKLLLDETRAGVLLEEQAMEELIADKERTIKEYETDIGNKEQAIKEYEADIQEQKEIIEALEAAIAAEKKKLLEEQQSLLTYDGGQFKFPLASYTRLSDDYGMRMHPTLGVEKFHNGIDLAAPTGTAIYAAYDGKVVAASYSSSMGNYVMIDHGDELYTIYMHASKLYVSAGDVVVKGETIAAVGSTGRSTGPHLHFGVRLNGAYTSPWNYLSK